MKDKLIYCVLVILLIAVVLVSGFMFISALNYDQSCDWVENPLQRIHIEGEYSEEGSPWAPLTRETKFDYIELRDITVRGHFTMDLPKGTELFLKIDQLRVAIRVNGEEVLRFEPSEGDGNPTQAIGKLWYTFISPGISTSDEVELNFGNLYRNAYLIQFDELLWDMRIGNERILVLEAMKEDGWLWGIGVTFLFLTLFLIFVSLICVMLKIQGAFQFICLGLTSLFSAMWFCTLAPSLSLLCPWPVFFNLLYSYSIQGIVVFATLFVVSNVTGWRKRALLTGIGAIMMMLLFDMARQILGIKDLFSAIGHFSILDIIVAACIIICIIYEIREREYKGILLKLLKAMLPLVFFGVLELLNGYIQFSQAAICFGLGLISFVILQSYFMLERIKVNLEIEKRALELESELTQSRILVMLSQIQPHFLYNALNTIHYLCRIKSDEAAEAVKRFSEYLRGNMDSLSDRLPIPFDRELRHMENYLSIEKIRFPFINIIYDLKSTDFLLPSLTLQPLVENAICHGVTQREEDIGTVEISTWEDNTSFFVRVEDDGVGFDITQTPNDGRDHIGIANTRNRLEAMCEGTLQVESTEGIGTRVTISIPRKGDENEHTCSG